MAHYNNPQHPGDPVDRPSSACKLSRGAQSSREPASAPALRNLPACSTSPEQNKDYRGQLKIVTYDCVTEVCSMAGEESSRMILQNAATLKF